MKFCRFLFTYLGTSSLCLAILFALSVVLFTLPTQAQAQNVETPASSETACRDGLVNVEEYVAPREPLGFIQASSVGEGFNHHDVSSQVEWVDGTNFLQHANQVHFMYSVEDGMIRFKQDTIWDNFRCSDTGADSMYRVFNAATGAWGGNYLRTQMSCGDSVISNQYLVAYEYNPAIEEPGNHNMDLNECNVAGQSRIPVVNTAQLFFQGEAECNGKPVDAIGVRTLGGAGAGEVFFYCKGYGLCAWYRSPEFIGDTSPSEWDKDTDVCDFDGKRSSPSNLDDTYLFPLNGIINQDPGTLNNELQRQGYEVRCTSPQLKISASVNRLSEEAYQMYGGSGGPLDVDTAYVQTTTELKADYTKAEIPLWRDSKLLPKLKESLENYWGLLDTTEEDPIKAKIASAPIYSLLSSEQLCNLKMEMLLTEKRLCLALDQGPGVYCPLEKKISDTGWTPTDIRFVRKKAIGLVGEENVTCKALTNGDYEKAIKAKFGRLGDPESVNPRGGTPEYYLKMKNALMKTPLYFDNAYRLAFLVLVAELQGPEPGEEPPAGQFPFNFLRGDATAKPRHEVRVLAFKVPDFGTNRKPESELYYKDALELTRDSLLPQTTIDAIAEEYNLQRDTDYTEYIPDDLQILPIICIPGAGEYCTPNPVIGRNAIVQGITSFVNQKIGLQAKKSAELYGEGDAPISTNDYFLRCSRDEGDIPTETVQEIFSLGGLDEESDGAKHNVPLLGNIVTSLKTEWIDGSVGSGDTKVPSYNFLSQMDANEPGRHPDGQEAEAQKAKIRSYLVLPQGYQLEAAEEVLAATMYDADEMNEFRRNRRDEKYGYAAIAKAPTRFEEVEDNDANKEITVWLPAWCNAIPEQLRSLNPLCRKETTRANISGEGDLVPRILGPSLGFIMRELQMSIYPANSIAWNFVKSCKTTEDFLKGRCQGGKSDTSPTIDRLSCAEQYKDITDEAERLAKIEACVAGSDEGDESADEPVGKYCIDWKTSDLSSGEIEQLKDNARSYLTSLDYSYDQPNSTEFQKERFQEVMAQTFTRWDGQVIPHDKINIIEKDNGGGRSLLWTRDPACGGQACFDYIMDTCAAAGYNPALCVAMNLSETGGSNHIRFSNSYDFGCILNNPADIKSNLSCLTNNFFDNYTEMDYNQMWQKYAGLGFESSSYGNVKDYYASLSGGVGMTEGECK